jgi:hypothetical protein
MPLTIAFAVVQNSEPLKIISSQNVETVSKEATHGIFHVQFKAGSFNAIPAVTVTQIYPGHPTDPIGCSGSSGGDTRDNAVIICIEKDFCRIKTGGSGGGGENRSFSITAIGS